MKTTNIKYQVKFLTELAQLDFSEHEGWYTISELSLSLFCSESLKECRAWICGYLAKELKIEEKKYKTEEEWLRCVERARVFKEIFEDHKKAVEEYKKKRKEADSVKK